MKTKITISIALLLILSVISCQTNLRIQKRKYMKGYNVQLFINSVNEKQQAIPALAKDSSKSSLTSLKPLLPKAKQEEVTASTAALPAKTAESKKQINHLNVTPRITSSSKLSVAKPNVILQVLKQTSTTTWAWWYSLLATALMSSMVLAIRRSGKINFTKLQKWAHNNKLKARTIIVLSRVLFLFTGIFSGAKLYEAGYTFSESTHYVLFSGFILGYVLHPFKKSKSVHAGIFSRKTISSILLSITGLMLSVSLGNKAADENAHHINTDKHINWRVAQFTSAKQSTPTLLHSSSATPSTDEPKEPGEIALQVVATIFAILSIIVLQAVILVFSCMLMCEGQEGTAAVILLGGTLLLAYISIITFYWIKRIKFNHDTLKGTTS